jgi:hypothetical protein
MASNDQNRSAGGSNRRVGYAAAIHDFEPRQVNRHRDCQVMREEKIEKFSCAQLHHALAARR